MAVQKANFRTYVELPNGTTVQVMPGEEIPTGGKVVHEFAEGQTTDQPTPAAATDRPVRKA
jgi:hypothetical protein